MHVGIGRPDAANQFESEGFLIGANHVDLGRGNRLNMATVTEAPVGAERAVGNPGLAVVGAHDLQRVRAGAAIIGLLLEFVASAVLDRVTRRFPDGALLGVAVGAAAALFGFVGRVAARVELVIPIRRIAVAVTGAGQSRTRHQDDGQGQAPKSG